MATGIDAKQKIYVNGKQLVTVEQLHEAYVTGRLPQYTIAFVDPDDLTTVKYQHVDYVYSEGPRLGVRLTVIDDRTVTIAAGGLVIDVAEDAPLRRTVRFPSDAKCIYGMPDNLDTNHMVVRQIYERKFVTIDCMTLPVPNVITADGFIVVF